MGATMKPHKILSLSALALGLLPAPAAFAGLIVNPAIDVIGNLALSDFTNNQYGTQAYKDWGNEPSVAVNPTNPNDIWISSFSFGTSVTTTGANVFYSTNGGSSWTSQFSIPAPASGVGIPNDWRFAYDSAGNLHGAILGGCNATCNVYQGSTANPTSLAAWTYTGGGTPINDVASRNNADQPWIAVSGNTVFVAYDDFHSNTGERVAVSTNGGATFTVDNAINNGAQANSVNPGTRIAVDSTGGVYSIFGVGTPTATDGVNNVTYYLNRSRDGGVTWDFNGSSAIGGILITSGVSTQLCNSCTQASNNWFAHVNDLRGNVTAIAPDSSGNHVYALIGKQDANGVNRIYLESYVASGTNLVKTNEIVISPNGQQAALPAITVKADGTVVMMYETVDANGRVHVHFASSDDFGATISSDIDEYDFTPLSLLAATGSTTANREFGDYVYLTSIGNTFYGTFAGLGDVNSGGINTTGLIDPFLVIGTDSIPEPSSIALLLPALLGFFYFRRRYASG